MKNSKIEIKKYNDVYKIGEHNIVEISIKPSLSLLSKILDMGSNMKTIVISKNLYKLINKKAWKVIEEFGIEVKAIEKKRGRRKKYKELEKLLKRENHKISIRKLAKKYNIPKSSIHNIMKKINKR